MNKKCAKCTKTVYPTEELKCLDKIWHKFCFKCEVCGMTLNMKNYKGYEKLPYCNAHYPQSKPTAVADTPESRRIAENTKIQSSIQYHADFERQKGHKTSVANDPETARIKQNTANQSNVNYWGVKDTREQMEHKRPTETVDDVRGRSRNPGKISEYSAPVEEPDFASPYSQRNAATVVYDSSRGGEGGESVAIRSPPHTGSSRPGSHSYGTPFSYGGSPPGGRPGSQRISQTSYTPEPDLPPPPPQQQPYSYGDLNPSPQQSSYGGQGGPVGGQRFSYTPQSPSGRVAGGGYSAAVSPIGYTDRSSSYSDRNSGYGDRSSGYGDRNSGYGNETPQAPQAAPPQPQPVRVSQPPPPKQPCYQAVYDYTAADTDEVSFVEGDIIVNAEKVDEGWMTGMVQRTGQHGMLPSNYVEQV